DGGTSIITTSSGDNQLDVSDPSAPDRWLVVDDVNLGDPFLTSSSLPATAFVFDGTGAARRAGAVSFAAADPLLPLGPEPLTYGWNRVGIQRGQTGTFRHVAVQQVGRPGAQASAERLEQLPPEALAGLSADEVATVQNFALPQDGVSPLAPLPSLAAT